MTTSTADAGVQSERPGRFVSSTQTEHPLKQDTGTGTDYTPAPDRHTYEPPPSSGPGSHTVHMSNTRKQFSGNTEELSTPVFHQGSGASSSFGLPPGPDAPAKVNPMEKPKRGPPSPEKVPVQSKPMEVDEKAMNLQRQENARKEFEAQQKREKIQAITTFARDHLSENTLNQLRNRRSIKEATMAQQSVLRPVIEKERNRARSENLKDKRNKEDKIPQFQPQAQKTAQTTDDMEHIKPPRSKTRSKSKPKKEEDIPQVVKQKAIRDRTESEPTPQLRQPPKRLALKDRQPSPEIPQASKARSRSRGRSQNPDKEDIKGPSKEEFKRSALPTKHVLNALAHHDVNQLEKATNIINEMHAEHADKKQKVGKGVSKTTKAKKPRPRAIRA